MRLDYKEKTGKKARRYAILLISGIISLFMSTSKESYSTKNISLFIVKPPIEGISLHFGSFSYETPEVIASTDKIEGGRLVNKQRLIYNNKDEFLLESLSEIKSPSIIIYVYVKHISRYFGISNIERKIKGIKIDGNEMQFRTDIDTVSVPASPEVKRVEIEWEDKQVPH